MNPQSIEAINPLVADMKIQGRNVNIIFQCPISGQQFPARHYQKQDQSIGGQALKSTQRSVMYAIQNTVSQLLRNIFGNGVVGRTAGNVARQTVYATSRNMQNSLSSKEKQQAILAAFQSVSKNFTWDDNRGQWLASQALKDSLSAFDQQRTQFPVQHPYDLQILSRMLVEVAMVDGTITKEENEWLTNMLNPANGTIEAIASRPKLSPAELSEVSAGSVRETILMLAWTLALCDEDFAASEKQLLMFYGQSLQLSAIQIGQIQSKAQQYILENALEYMFAWGGQDQFARQNILQLATKIGLSQREAMEVEARFQRRNA